MGATKRRGLSDLGFVQQREEGLGVFLSSREVTGWTTCGDRRRVRARVLHGDEGEQEVGDGRRWAGLCAVAMGYSAQCSFRPFLLFLFL